MPKAKRKKIALGLDSGLIVTGLLLIIGLLFVGFLKHYECKGAQLGNDCYELEKVETPEARQKGLSNREELSSDKAMLFVFESANRACMWMKDMKFNIDMIWLNKDKKIIKIEEDVSPSTYPKNFCANDTKYVLELNSRSIEKTDLKVGDQINL